MRALSKRVRFCMLFVFVFFSVGVGGGRKLRGRGCAPQVLGTFNTFHLMASLEAGLDVSGKFIVLAKKRML